LRTAPARKGCEQPRIFTPPLRELTADTSLGFAVVEFATEVCGIDLFPWQRWLLIHALELLEDGSFRFRNVIVLVARQNGKSTLSQVLALFFVYVLGTALVIGTAQDLDVAEEIWQGAVDIVEETPELDEQKLRVVKTNGKKALELKSGERYKVKAANRRAGRGLSGDLILLDELREHQSWDAWGAITKTTIARPNAQVWALSNAGDATSVVLRYLRKMAHKALGDPDGVCAADDPSSLLPSEDDLLEQHDDLDVDDDFAVEDDTLGIFEWSAAPGCDKTDLDGLAQANPSLGHSITLRTLASAAKTDPEWVFRTECLCQWTDGTLEGPFPPGSWDAGRCVGEAPQIVGKVQACVDVTPDRSRAVIAFAGYDAAGRAQVEIVASRAGVEWVEKWVRARLDVIEFVTGQGRGAPVSGLLDELVVAGLPVEKWEGPDLPAGTGRFYDAIRDNEVTHLPQPVLDVAAATAVPKLTAEGAFLWDRRKSPTDITPLIAVTGAHWLLTRPQESTASVYEERGFIVLDL
jgi:hypothetical protein